MVSCNSALLNLVEGSRTASCDQSQQQRTGPLRVLDTNGFSAISLYYLGSIKITTTFIFEAVAEVLVATADDAIH